jgi:DNA-binding NarL/FixJ family response regulator
MSTNTAEGKSKVRSRILLVDDHPVVRQGLVRLIDQEPDLIVCGEAGSADEALAAIERLAPALVLVDLSLRGKPGLELIKDMRIQHPRTLVMVLSMHDESIWAERALRAGACGYAMKQENPRELINRIRRALNGEMSLSERMSARLISRLSGRRAASSSAQAGAGAALTLEILGDRELEVLQMIGEGMTMRQIAAAMHISQKTVEAHREHIKQKLHLQSGAELLRYAVIRGLEESR